MSFTVSQGLVDAQHWTAISAIMAAYIDECIPTIEAKSDLPEQPKGAIFGAKRFFEAVLDGVRLDRREAPSGKVPAMAGISNLSIAADVLTADPKTVPTSLAQIEATARKHLGTLTEIESGDTEDLETEDLRDLASFFRQLLRQGNLEREAAIASAEHPTSIT